MQVCMQARLIFFREIEESCSRNALGKQPTNDANEQKTMKNERMKKNLSNCTMDIPPYHNLRLLTLFLHVTSTRYFVSGQRDNSTLDVSVNRLPINPPP